MERLAYISVVVGVLCIGVVYAAVHNDNTLRFKANSAGNAQVNKMTQKSSKNQDGHLDPCSSSDPKFKLTWTPGIIKLGENVKVEFDMTPTLSLSKGSVSVTIWLPDYDDPIYQIDKDFRCNDIHKFLPSECPFQKGKRIDLKKSIPVKSSLPLPGGSFRVKVKVTNEEKKVFACIAGNITIANSYNAYDYDGY